MSAQTLVAPLPSHTSTDLLAGQAVRLLVGAPTSTRYDADERRIELWSPWYGRRRPSTAREEAVFVARLRELAGPLPHGSARAYTRHDVTSLVTALRTALTAEEMLDRAPGLQPAVLLAAYDDLEQRRDRSVDAWRTIVAAPSAHALEVHGSAAGVLLPVVVSHLRALRLRRKDDLATLAAVIHDVAAEIERTTMLAELLEQPLDGPVISQQRAEQIGEALYDTFGDGAWSMSTYLPARIGSLVPARLAALLGENRPDRIHDAG